jgi:diguanylate cyclase (GGDEF)-like protein
LSTSRQRSPWSLYLTAVVGWLAFASTAWSVGPHPAQALIDRAAVAVRTDPEASRRDAEKALALLATQPDPDLEVRAHLLLCDHLSERDRAAAENQVALARALLSRVTRRGLEAGVLTCQGTILETAGDNAQAREYYEQAVRIATDTGDSEMLAQALFSRGYLLGLQGQYSAGLIDLKRAQATFEQLDLPHHALTALNGIAIMYNRMGDYAQAIDMYTRALKAQRDAGMRREQGVTLHNIGRSNEILQQWDAAQKAFEECYAISRELNYTRGEAYALRGMAAVANGKGNPQAALTTLERAAALQRQTPDARLNAQILLARGVALHQLNRLSASAAALQNAVNIFLHADSRNELRATYAELASVQAEMGNWHEAYNNQRLAQDVAERLFRNQIDQRFATLRVEFDTAAKEKENALLLRENATNQKALAQGQKARRLQAAVIVLTVILAVLLATLAVHQWRTTRRMHALAMTDELTGVPNRRAVLAQLEPLLGRSGGACAMLIIDIDHFKSINDQHGHPEGDEALKLVATRLRGEVHEPAFIGRLGGEEFVVVLPGVGAEEAHRVAEGFREQVTTLDTRRWLESKRITVSIGLTVARASGDTSSTMLQRADAALYEAKRAGRNCVRMNLPAHPEPSPASESRPAGASDIEYA